MSLQEFAIIDSTLREGEQCARAFFSTEQKVRLATILDAFGVEYLELSSPMASPKSRSDCEKIAALGLRAKVLTHVRCCMQDARAALETGVGGVNVMIATSEQLRRLGHGKSIDGIIAAAEEVLPYLVESGVEVRFSTEDSLRSRREDLHRVYAAVERLGVHRVGIADTLGIGSPREIHELVAEVRARVGTDIEFHGHDDSGCAIANAFAALEAGATHIDTTVLGIGERNGITSLSGLIARLYVCDSARIRARYRLELLPEIDAMVAGFLGTEIPFNNHVTGASAFAHKAGIHTKAVLGDPASYEALRPEDFGLRREVLIAHRLTGWNAVRHRALELGLDLPDALLRETTTRIKEIADTRLLSTADVDAMLAAAATPQACGAAAEEVLP